MTSLCEMVDQIIQKKQEEKQIQEDQAANTRYWKIPAYYDDDDDEEESNSLKDNIISELPPCSAVTPNETIDSLIMGDEHLDTVSATKSDKFIKSSVENLVPNPKINSMRIDQHHFNAESDLVESMLNRDSSIISSSSKIDSLLDEFVGELTLLKSIPPGVDKTDCHPKNEIRLSQRMLYDNSSPRPPEEIISKNSNADIESFSPPSDTPVCYICTCEQCGNILKYGTCLNCNSGTRNSFTYDTIPESYDEVPNQPPQCHFNIYLCQICESNSHYAYECSQRIPLVYEPEPWYIQNFNDNDYSHDLPGVNPLINHHCCYECGNSLSDLFCYQCPCEFCGNGAHVGYNCPAQVPSFQTLPSFPQQYHCCEDYEVTHEPYQCQPKNHDYYHKQNSCYDSNSFGFDHGQPPQYTVNHPIFNAYNDLLSSRPTHMEQMEQLTSICEMFCQFIQKKQEEKRIEKEHAAKAQNSKIPVSMESDEFIKSSVENLVPNPCESEGENGYDVPASFTTFSNILFDADYESDSSDYQSCYDKDFLEEIFSNPLFEEEIIPIKIDQHHFNAESDLIKSMLNHDSSIIPSSWKIDSLLDEFAGELTLLKSIPPRINETDCYPEKDIRLTERLLYDNSSPLPPGIEEDDDDSERDMLIHEELLDNYSLSLPVIESFYFDIPSFSRPLAKPPDGNTGILNIKIMGDISDQK
nr:hypothetical protein [Tanacetum cinerariifolium]